PQRVPGRTPRRGGWPAPHRVLRPGTPDTDDEEVRMSLSTPVNGKVALVTGADSGIGRATAVRLAAAGMDVGITYLTDREGAEETAEEVRSHGCRAEVARLDLTELPGAADTVD